MKRLVGISLLLFSGLFAAYSQADMGNGEPVFEDDFSEGSGSFESSLEFSGTAATTTRLFIQKGIDSRTVDAVTLSGIPDLDLGISYKGSDADFFANLEIDSENLSGSPADMLDEIWIKAYLGFMNLQAGYVKTTWGKGDSLHVLDLLHGTDYSDFINTEGLESKMATVMLKADIPIMGNGLIELVWLPFRTTNRIPLSGDWVPKDISETLSAARELLYSGPNGDDGLYALTYAVLAGGLYTTVYNQTLAATGDPIIAAAAAAAAAGSSDAASRAAAQAEEQVQGLLDSLFYRDTRYSLEDTQLGLRITGTVGGFDYGVQYFWGTEKTPVLPDVSSVTSLNEVESLTLEYPRIHVFGCDAAFAAAGFNIRAEGAYTLMQDRDYVDYISYTAGFDRAIPLNNLNINFQILGTYYLGEHENGCANLAAVQVSDSWYYDKIRPKITTAYGFENGDGMAEAVLEWDIVQDFTMSLKYRLFYGDEDSRFGQFDDNDYAELQFRFSF